MGSALDARAAYQVTRTCHKRPRLKRLPQSRSNHDTIDKSRKREHLHRTKKINCTILRSRTARLTAAGTGTVRQFVTARERDLYGGRATSIATGCLWWWCRVVCPATHVNHPDMVCLHTNSVGRSSWSSVRPCCRHAVLDNVGAHTYTNYWAKGLVGWRCCPSSSS